MPGHHFIARGLGGPFRTSILDRWSGDDHPDARLMAEFEEAGGYPAFTLEYELVPGVSAAEGEGNFSFPGPAAGDPRGDPQQVAGCLARDRPAALARRQRVAFRAESTVMSGTPLLSTLTEGLAGTDPIGLRGILNATANAKLTQMAGGSSFAEARAEAQRASAWPNQTRLPTSTAVTRSPRS